MIDIPPELWQDILTLACTDGGFTGRSLALTSRFFHAQSSSFRFRSLALNSLARVEGLVNFLRTHFKEDRPRIDDLLLSFLNEPVKTPVDFWHIYPKLSGEEHVKYRQNAEDKKKLWCERFVPAMTALLALVAPTLQTLCVLEHYTVPLPPLPFYTLPQLREFNMFGNIGAFVSIEPQADALSSTLPALQRLHLVSSSLNFPIRSFPAAFPTWDLPFLTHLRISGVNTGKLIPVDTLARTFGVDGESNPGTTTDTDRTAPPQLRHVVIQTFPILSATPAWDEVCRELESLKQRCRQQRNIHLIIARRPWRRNDRYADRLRDDWMDRVQGGHGCWVTDESEEAALDLAYEGGSQLQEVFY